MKNKVFKMIIALVTSAVLTGAGISGAVAAEVAAGASAAESSTVSTDTASSTDESKAATAESGTVSTDTVSNKTGTITSVVASAPAMEEVTVVSDAKASAPEQIPEKYQEFMEIEGFSYKNGKLYYYGLELNDEGMYEEKDSDGTVWTYDPLDPEFLEYFGDKINVSPVAEEQEVMVSVPKGSSNGSIQSSFNGSWYEYPSYVNGKSYIEGVDVSYYQKSIDWNALASHGVKFAFIRAGYRGYGDAGNMKTDTRVADNIQGAYNAGIKVGIYFLSQAMNTSEAAEEADKCASIISPYSSMISLPVIMDYEYAGSSTNPGRLKKQHVADMNSGRDYKAIHNAVLNSFFYRISSYGYKAGVYANKSMLQSQLYPSDISSDYAIWLANYTNATSYSDRLEGWQYTSSYTGFNSYHGGSNIDLNFWFDSSEEPYNPDEGQVRAFVTRLYRTTLEREPDESGREWWVQQLMSGSKTGAEVVSGFFLSDEMLSRGYSSSKIVELAYNGIMGRGSDANGKAYWVDALNSGTTYQFVVCGFVDSEEFTNLCKTYGIKKGSLSPTDNRDKNLGITKFVGRLYTKALGRGFDGDGLNYWCGKINDDTSKENVLDIALNGFLHSEEFLGKNLNDGEYVKVLYRTFLGREAESDGYRYWTEKLAAGESRDDIAAGFAYSEEFSNIMASYGL